jgi:hypothetical protein
MEEKDSQPPGNGKPQEPLSNDEIVQKEEQDSSHFPEDSHAPKQSATGSQQSSTDGNRDDKQQPTPAQTSADKSETKNMEVHHHGHVHHQKKWKEYIFQFLMLFLAVFCGFLAEYQLEHKIEKDRAKQYIVSFYEDLKHDTARMNTLIQYDGEKITAINSMYACYDTVLKNMKVTACMGLLIKYSRSNKGFVLTDRTLRQLANAGGFRLLHKEDADSIIAYDNLYKSYLDFQTTVFQQAQDNVRNTLNQLADFSVIAPYMLTTATLDKDTTSIQLTRPLLFNEDRVLLNKWFNELSLYLRTTNGQRNLIIQLKSKAIFLIRYLKEKYHYE